MSSSQAIFHKVPVFTKRLAAISVLLLALNACVSSPADKPVSDTSVATTGSVSSGPQDDDSDAQQDIASNVPDTDIFVFLIDPGSAQIVTSFDANVTSRVGYDNQPSYLPGTNNFVFSSILDGRQSDVYEYQEKTRSLTQRTRTELSEYSPTPLADGGFSSVVVEGDGTQRLWRFTPLGRALAPIRGDVTGVGYHAWLPGDQLAVFIVDEPLMHLDVVGVSDDSGYTLAVNPGRSLHARPGSGSLSFVQQFSGESGRLMDWDGSNLKALIRMPKGVEDITWLPDGRALTVAEHNLLVWSPETASWQVVFDLSSYLPGEVTRLAVNDSATRLAIVSSMTPPDAVE